MGKREGIKAFLPKPVAAKLKTNASACFMPLPLLTYISDPCSAIQTITIKTQACYEYKSKMLHLGVTSGRGAISNVLNNFWPLEKPKVVLENSHHLAAPARKDHCRAERYWCGMWWQAKRRHRVGGGKGEVGSYHGQPRSGRGLWASAGLRCARRTMRH